MEDLALPTSQPSVMTGLLGKWFCALNRKGLFKFYNNLEIIAPLKQLSFSNLHVKVLHKQKERFKENKDTHQWIPIVYPLGAGTVLGSRNRRHRRPRSYSKWVPMLVMETDG